MSDDLFSRLEAATDTAQAPKWPSEQLADLLSGRVSWEATPPAIQSWAALEIHKAAVAILGLAKDKRPAELSKIPASLHQMVKDECNRVWGLRR
jgi:hypothetical protein